MPVNQIDICPKCNKASPTLVRYWTDQGDTREAVEFGEIIYAAHRRDNKDHVDWHCMGCDYEWAKSNPDSGSYRADYVENNFLVNPRPAP